MSDRDADFSAFVEARWHALCRFAYLMTRDGQDAEDLVQTALVKVYVSWGRIKEPRSVESYTRTCMTRLFVNGRRRDRVKDVLLGGLPDVHAVDPQALAERDAVWAQLGLLPPRQRAVLVLRYYEDLSEVEIAEAMGCSRGTVKSQASKGLARLRQLAAVDA